MSDTLYYLFIIILYAFPLIGSDIFILLIVVYVLLILNVFLISAIVGLQWFLGFPCRLVIRLNKFIASKYPYGGLRLTGLVDLESVA